MALFAYTALTREGKKVKGTVDATSLEGARIALAKINLYPTSISPAQEAKGGIWSLLFFARRVSFKDKILFTKQLAVLLKSGVPLLQALELLIEQFNGKMRSVIIHLRDSIKEGKSFAQGLTRYPNLFDNIYIQLVRAGEATGRLETILERLVIYMERREEIARKVRSAMRYPLIQLSIIVLVVVALLMFVLPNLTAAFITRNVQLPWTTRLLMGLSDLIINYWYIMLLVLIALILAFRYWRSTKRGAYIYDSIKLKLPIISFFARMSALVQFCRTLSILVESGVNLAESLDIVVSIIDNRVLAQELDQARENIIKQGRIAEFLKQTKIFPPIATYLISTGEQSGQLDSMLLTVAQNYETELNEYADTLSSLLEPIMLLVMGLVVGFVVMSVIQPIMEQAQAINL